MATAETITKPPLTDAEPLTKYDNGQPVDFEAAIKKMVKAFSNSPKGKGR